MPISSNSVFHHTGKISNLKGILKSESFKVQYSTERIYTNGINSVHVAVPMVSFCDIPLTDYKLYFRHKKDKKEGFILGYYGDYGIALTKEWAIKQGLTPVIYVPKVQEGNRRSVSILNALIDLAQKSIPIGNLGNELSSYPSILPFCKHHTGYLEIEKKKKNENGKYITKYEREQYCFYNEREWRYVSKNIPIRWNFYNEKSDSESKSRKSEANKSITEILPFSLFQDVTMIIVKNDDEVHNIVGVLKELASKRIPINGFDKYSFEKELDVLCSKIVTTKQLLEDF